MEAGKSEAGKGEAGKGEAGNGKASTKKRTSIPSPLQTIMNCVLYVDPPPNPVLNLHFFLSPLKIIPSRP